MTKSGERTPYNLAVIPSTMVDRSDYYTLGASSSPCSSLELVPGICTPPMPHNRRTLCPAGLSGVCHFKNGTTEFTWLGRQAPALHPPTTTQLCESLRWQYEFGIFGQIRRLPFFRKFRRFKAYAIWRGQVRRTKCRRARPLPTPDTHIIYSNSGDNMM